MFTVALHYLVTFKSTDSDRNTNSFRKKSGNNLFDGVCICKCDVK